MATPTALARELTAEELAPLLPDAWELVPYAARRDITVTTVMVVLTDVVNPALTGDAPWGRRRHVLDVLVIDPGTTPGSADDYLDDALQDALGALDRLQDVSWSAATRTTYADTQPAWRITVTRED